MQIKNLEQTHSPDKIKNNPEIKQTMEIKNLVSLNIFPKTGNTKLIIQINCYNEEQTLPETLADLPKSIPGIDQIEVMIVDDGSTDDTIKVAREHGVKHIVQHSGNKGLPKAVNTGVFHALKLGADILVNTDADNQYYGPDIAKLVQPIVQKQADFVYGQRPIQENPEFSDIKKFFQLMGARVVSKIAGLDLQDAASGFRAINKTAMETLFLLSDYASPLENLIQAREKKLNIAIVPIKVNKSTRPSRLFKSMYKYIMRSAGVILENILLYHPTKSFGILGLVLFGIGAGTFVTRYIFRIVLTTSTNLHLSLLILSIVFGILGVQMMIFAFSARLNKVNRKILEEIMYRQNTILGAQPKVNLNPIIESQLLNQEIT